MYSEHQTTQALKNVEVLSEVSLNELDLTLEAAAADELAENFKDHPNYNVPKIYWEFTTKNMLVLEFVEGVRIDDLDSLKTLKHNIKRITEIGTEEYFFLQVFRWFFSWRYAPWKYFDR